jgi:hypothetical protein
MDGTVDCNDGCPNDPNKIQPGMCGCGVPDVDSDMDGTADCNDGCPNDPNKIQPGICGCGASDMDSDMDGTPNCNDGCPSDPLKTSPGVCGCGNPEPGSQCNDGDPNTINDVITSGCVCIGTPTGPNTCTDGIQNGNETGIDCGGSCPPCQAPDALCGIVTVYVNPDSPAYNGPSINDVWWSPAENFDAGSTASSSSPSITVRRFQSNIPFNWTTNGACIDATPNAVTNSADHGTVYRSCLPVATFDFNKWKVYQLRISDAFGFNECYGKFRVLTQTTMLSTPILHFAFTDSDGSLPEHTLNAEHSEEEGGHYSTPEIEDLSLAPNPGMAFMTIRWNSSIEMPVVVKIYSASGAEILKETIDALRGENQVFIDMEDNMDGIYFVQVQSAIGISTLKWVKQVAE